MGLELDSLPAGDSLDQLKQRIRGKEKTGYELLTLARGQVDAQMVNLATFRQRGFGDDPGPLTLVPIAGSSEAQEKALNAGETGGHRLISYGGVLVAGQEINVAVYRG